MQYPCKLPKIQIDTWGQKASSVQCSTDTLAALLFTKYNDLVAMSLLYCNRATTVPAIANSIRQVRDGVHSAALLDGQIYIQPNWRVRWEHMTKELQQIVCKQQKNVTDAFAAHYNAQQIERSIMSIIGPARSEGVKCYLRWKCPRDTRPIRAPA